MINFTTETTTTVDTVKSIMCDCCRKTFSNVMDTQEFTCIDAVGGYNSAIGDGARYRCDLCSDCVKELLGQYLRIEAFE